MKYNWADMTDVQKNKAIEIELSRPTHMGTTKDDFIEIVRYQTEKIERVRAECKGKVERLKGYVDNPIFEEDNPRIAAAINAYGHILKILEEAE